MNDIAVAIATGRTAKAAIAGKHLAPYGIVVEQAPIRLEEIQSTSMVAIAQYKARHAFEALVMRLLVEDSGFGLDELGG